MLLRISWLYDLVLSCCLVPNVATCCPRSAPGTTARNAAGKPGAQVQVFPTDARFVLRVDFFLGIVVCGDHC